MAKPCSGILQKADAICSKQWSLVRNIRRLKRRATIVPDARRIAGQLDVVSCIEFLRRNLKQREQIAETWHVSQIDISGRLGSIILS